MAKRKNFKELKSEYYGLLNDVQALENRISQRLLDLCQQNPDVLIKTITLDSGEVVNITSSRICDPDYIKKCLNTDLRLLYIELIEKSVEAKQPFVQTTIKL